MLRTVPLFVALLLILSAAASLELQAQPGRIIDVVKGYEPIPLAIVPFEAKQGKALEYQRQLHTVLEYDLDFTNYFYLMPNRGSIETIDAGDRQSGKIQYASWREIGADAVVKGTVDVLRNGEIEVTFSLYYTKGGTRVAEKKYQPVRPERLRNLVHHISDEIVFSLTGNAGIAQTRFVFIYELIEQGKSIRELYLIDYDGHSDSLKRVTRDRDMVATPAWSPDGKQIAFTSYFQKNPDLNLIDLQTGNRQVISGQPGLNSSPCWHPDGKTIALVMTKDGNSELYRLDQGKGLTRLTSSREIESSPCFSTDGKQIAYTSDRGRILQLYVMGAGGGTGKRITPGNGWYDLPAWSPWGDLLAFVGSKDARRQFDIYVAKSDGSQMQQLTRNAKSNESPCWSPDGRHIVFTSNRDGNWNLYTVDRLGGHVRRITYLPGNCYTPDWSPNMRE